jgi:acetylornithine/succinyldiaminopimelate/putrescine aminotransferase
MSTPIRTVHADGDGGLVIETKQDITEILEANKAQREQDKQRQGFLNELHHVARIPNAVIDDLNQKGIMRGFVIVDEAAFAQFLNGTEIGQACRTYRGTI